MKRQRRYRYTPPVRYWRWIWAAQAVRYLVAFPVFAVIILPYLAAKAILSAGEWWAGKQRNFYARCVNRDKARARELGWRGKTLFAPPIRIRKKP